MRLSKESFLPSDLPGGLYSIHDGHLKVHDDQFVSAAALLVSSLLDQLNCLFAIDGLIGLEPEFA